MTRIQVLEEHVANQIAAGEVVERPASVAKELIENAIDANAKRVTLVFRAGGVDLLRVIDDGIGMAREDAVLAPQRHATSKLADTSDLLSLRTFGFRGEALPSIASVSKLRLQTRRAEDAEGTEVWVLPDGKIDSKPSGSSVGTTVEVGDLFYNVPARRKFLKSEATEAAQLGETLTLAALSAPSISFTLKKEDKVTREYLSMGNRSGRVGQVFANEKLIACQGERGPLRMEAYLSQPEKARATASHLLLFINGRPVRDRVLLRAVAQSYGSVLEQGRYPYGVVYLDLPADLVDINVHPQKTEVRFLDARSVFDVVSKELREGLARSLPLAAVPARNSSYGWNFGYGKPSGISRTLELNDRSAAAPQRTSAEGLPFASRAGAAPTPAPEGSRDNGGVGPATSVHPTPVNRSSVSDTSAPESSATPAGSRVKTAEAPQLRFAEDNDIPGFYGSLTFIHQLQRTFLLCEGEDALYILDQHAAHERVTFDRLKRAHSDSSMTTQRLLVPETITVTESSASYVEQSSKVLEGIGFDLRRTGPTSVTLHGIPAFLKPRGYERSVLDLLAELEREAVRPFSQTIDLVLATMACHGSIRSGDLVSKEEVSAMLRDLDRVDFAGHCPHGRPIVTRVSFAELERRVGR